MTSTTEEDGKMTALNKTVPRPARKKFDQTRYAGLLSEALPVVIKTEAEYHRMLKVVDRLLLKEERLMNREELALLDLVSTLIEQYEDKHHKIPDVPGHQILASLLEERGLKQCHLLPVFGSRGVISELVSGKRPIGLKVARKLGKFFDISPEVFLPL